MRRAVRLLVVLVAMLLGASQAQAQTGTVVGRVVDAASRQPLAGVQVSVQNRGALTQSTGAFVIGGVPAGAQTVRATMIGYGEGTQTVQVSAGQTATANFELSVEALGLAEIVVTAYGQQRAGNVTGSIKQVTPTEFNRGRIVSPQELLTAKVPGVQIVDNNEPGGGNSVRIRGATSINASSEPLYVIDGMPIGTATGGGMSVATGVGGGMSAGRNPLNFINPNDIESITVLKDAASAAMYGANAANGVILIKTRSGKGAPDLEYTGSVSASRISRLPDMLNAAQFRTAVQTYAPQNVSQLGNANTDWFDAVDQAGIGQEHNLSLSGSGTAMDYRFSVGFLDQKGVIQGTRVQRLSVGASYDQRFFDDRLALRANLKASRAEDLFTPGGVVSNAAQMGPTQPLRDANHPTGYFEWPGNTLQSPDNPLAILALSTDQGSTTRSVGNLRAEYDLPFISGLKAHANLGYDLTDARRETFSPRQLHSQLKAGGGGNVYRRDPSMLSTVLETYLNYSAPLRAFPGWVDVTGGYSYSESRADNPWFSASGLSTDLLDVYGVPGAQIVTNQQDIQESRLISFFGRLNYNYSDKYLLGFSVRRDGSSRFGPDNAWGVFPAASMAWRISEESFMKDATPFSDLKLRASWGKTGNQAFANYQQYSTYMVGTSTAQAQFGNEFVSTIRPSAADPGIKWEETTSWDVGADFGLFEQRLSGSIEWYVKDTKDLIFTVPVAAGTNLSNYVTTNIGSMKNNGLEIALSGDVLRGGSDGLTWNATLNAARNTNELVSINPFAGGSQQILTGNVSGGVGTLIQVLQPGSPINSFYVYEHKRNGNGTPVWGDTNGDKTINEQDLYVDQNGDGIVNVADRRAFQDPAPDWVIGHTSSLQYGAFDLDFTLRAYLGNYVYNNVASNLGTYAEVTRASPYNLHASVLKTGFVTPQYLSDYYVEDASFLRLDNITLGYRFDLKGRSARVFGTIQSAFTMTGYSGVDPTAGLNGLDNNIYPRSRTFTGGLSVRF